MTAAALTPALLPAAPIELVDVGETWAALSIPSDWGRQVLGVLGDKSGPVFDEPARLHLVCLLPLEALPAGLTRRRLA